MRCPVSRTWLDLIVPEILQTFSLSSWYDLESTSILNIIARTFST